MLRRLDIGLNYAPTERVLQQLAPTEPVEFALHRLGLAAEGRLHLGEPATPGNLDPDGSSRMLLGLCERSRLMRALK
jgi:hypothetical protein